MSAPAKGRKSKKLRSSAAFQFFRYAFDGFSGRGRYFPGGLDSTLGFLFSLSDDPTSLGFGINGGAGDTFLFFADGGGGAFGSGDDFSGSSPDGFAGIDDVVLKRVRSHELLLEKKI